MSGKRAFLVINSSLFCYFFQFYRKQRKRKHSPCPTQIRYASASDCHYTAYISVSCHSKCPVWVWSLTTGISSAVICWQFVLLATITTLADCCQPTCTIVIVVVVAVRLVLLNFRLKQSVLSNAKIGCRCTFWI